MSVSGWHLGMKELYAGGKEVEGGLPAGPWVNTPAT